MTIAPPYQRQARPAAPSGCLWWSPRPVRGTKHVVSKQKKNRKQKQSSKPQPTAPYRLAGLDVSLEPLESLWFLGKTLELSEELHENVLGDVPTLLELSLQTSR